MGADVNQIYLKFSRSKYQEKVLKKCQAKFLDKYLDTYLVHNGEKMGADDIGSRVSKPGNVVQTNIRKSSWRGNRLGVENTAKPAFS